MERWKILHSAKDLKQKKRNVKRSADVSGNARHFCDDELNFTPEFNYRIREKALRNESLDRNPGRNVKRSADVSGSGRRFCFFEPDYTGCEAERQKPRMISQCEVILLRSISPAKFIRHS